MLTAVVEYLDSLFEGGKVLVWVEDELSLEGANFGLGDKFLSNSFLVKKLSFF